MEDTEDDPIPIPLQVPQMPQKPQMPQVPQTTRPMVHVPKFAPPPSTDPAELESANWQLSAQPMTGVPTNWQLPAQQPMTVAPANLSLFKGEQQVASPVVRPTLQVQTTDLSQHNVRAQPPRRSKMLAPSSSVRSTASTNSTNSTASSGSYVISPMTSSSWSDEWARAPGYESTLTTPADEFAPNNPFGPSHKPAPEFPTSNPFLSEDAQLGVNDQLDVNMGQTELPANIPIMMGVIPPTDPAAALNPFQPPFPFGTTTTSDLPLDTDLSLNGNIRNQTQFPRLELEPTGSDHGRAHSLVKTAWGALQMHVAESMERLQNIENNHLVVQLLAMSPELVTSAGLKALNNILDRVMVESPIDLLCFIHLVYSFSVVIHEQDAPSRGSMLFSQAISYASWLTKPDRRPYFTIVNALWKPSGMEKGEVVALMRKTSNAAASRPKGKQPQHLAPEPSMDSLAFVAQFFLDGKSCEENNDTWRGL